MGWKNRGFSRKIWKDLKKNTGRGRVLLGSLFIYIYIFWFIICIIIYLQYVYIYMFASDTICFAVSEVLLAYFLKFLLSDSHQGSTISFTECSNSEVKHKKDVGGGFNISLIFIPIIFGR